MIDALRSFLALRDPHVRETIAAYHRRRRVVPMSPGELADSWRRRVARQVAEKGGERLPLGDGGRDSAGNGVGECCEGSTGICESASILAVPAPRAGEATAPTGAGNGYPLIGASPVPAITPVTSLPNPSSDPQPQEIRNPLAYAAVWLCPTPGCRSNTKSGALPARYWAGGDRNYKDKPRCNWCGEMRVWVEAGGVLETENATTEEPTT